MAMEQAKKFIELLQSDTELQKKVQQADAAYAQDHKDMDKEAATAEILLAVAKEAGYDVTAEELLTCVKPPVGGVADSELETVAGGKGFCFIIGGSSGDEYYATEGDNAVCYRCYYVGAGFGINF